jgi:hypothetical protein
LGVFSAISTASAANIVLNGGFTTGDFTDWSANVPVDGSEYWLVANNADSSPSYGVGYNGDFYFAAIGCGGAACITGPTDDQASLTQNLATTAGATYTLTFAYYTNGWGYGTPTNGPNELDVLWNGTSVDDLGPGGTLGSVEPYTVFTVTGLVATSSSTPLTFLGREDTGFNDLDGIDVEQTSGAPEPSTWMLMGGAILSFLGAVRRGTFASR